MRFAHSLRRPASSHRSAPGVSAGARSSHSPRPKRGAILARSSQLRHRLGPITGLTRRFRAGCPIACLVGFLQKRVILAAADTPIYLMVHLVVRRHKRRDPSSPSAACPAVGSTGPSSRRSGCRSSGAPESVQELHDEADHNARNGSEPLSGSAYLCETQVRSDLQGLRSDRAGQETMPSQHAPVMRPRLDTWRVLSMGLPANVETDRGKLPALMMSSPQAVVLKKMANAVPGSLWMH